MGLRSIFIDRVDVWRPTVTVSGMGAAQARYDKIASGVKGRIVDYANTERKVQGKEDMVSDFVFLCSTAEDIKSDDDIRLRAGDFEHVFRVNRSEDLWRVRREHHQEVYCTLISKTGFHRADLV